MKAEDYLKTTAIIYEVNGHFFRKKEAAVGVAKQLHCEVITHRKEEKKVAVKPKASPRVKKATTTKRSVKKA